MTKKLQNWMTLLTLTVVSGSVGLAVATATPTFAAPAPPSGGPPATTCNDHLLTFPAWYRGLTDGNCDIKSPADVGGLPNFIWKIVLNVIEVGLQLAGYLATGFIIRGGFKYMTSIGDPGELAKAKKIITDAIIGLVLSLLSVAIVNVVAGAF